MAFHVCFWVFCRTWRQAWTGLSGFRMKGEPTALSICLAIWIDQVGAEFATVWWPVPWVGHGYWTYPYLVFFYFWLVWLVPVVTQRVTLFWFWRIDWFSGFWSTCCWPKFQFFFFKGEGGGNLWRWGWRRDGGKWACESSGILIGAVVRSCEPSVVGACPPSLGLPTSFISLYLFLANEMLLACVLEFGVARIRYEQTVLIIGQRSCFTARSDNGIDLSLWGCLVVIDLMKCDFFCLLVGTNP